MECGSASKKFQESELVETLLALATRDLYGYIFYTGTPIIPILFTAGSRDMRDTSTILTVKQLVGL